MKLRILLLTLIVAIASGEELHPAKFLQGQCSRDVAGALARAKTAGKPVVIITYDPASKEKRGTETANFYAIRCFTEVAETRRLLAQNFIQVLAPWSAKGVAELRDMEDKTGLPVAIFLDRQGAVIERVPCQINPAEALRRVQALIAMAGQG